MAKKPHANSKLKNIDAIQKMLDGTHSSQTKTITGFTGKSNNEKHEVGDIWIDSAGVEWEQKNGFRVKNPTRAKRIAEIKKLTEMPVNCPNCKTHMTKRLDKKFWGLHKMCMDCVIDMEHKMRIDGTYRDYERQKMLANVKSWLADAEREKEVLKIEITKDSYVNSDGTLEKWSLPYDPVEMQEKIENDFQEFKNNLLKQYGATEEELDGENDG